LQQFSEIKKVLRNISFIEKAKRIVSPEILLDVLDEIRRERKILMVIQDDNVDQYINMDMTEIDIYTAENNEGLSHDVKLACATKVAFRNELAQKISVIRLDYILRVMRKVFLGK